MLGLLDHNHLIHPGLQSRVDLLQEHLAKPLSAVEPAILREILGFYPRNVLPLSVTDSICEAVRSGVQHEIPVFGVDLEEFAQRPESYRLTDDLREQEFDLDDYTRHGERFTHIRDPYIDFRRETAMAARLKFLLSRHKKVLFVGGLAHWTSITALLGDDTVRPAELLIRNSKPPGKRVIIHPSMAVNYMDHFPVMSTLYEAWRAAASGGEKEPFPMAGKVSRDILQKTFQEYAGQERAPGDVSDKGELMLLFDNYVRRLCLLSGRKFPSMADLLETARILMPEAFYTLLLDNLMDLGQPWASSSMFPQYPVISSQRSGVRLFPAEPGERPLQHHFTEWKWKDEAKIEPEQRWFPDWIWPPCEAVLFGSAWEAQKIALTVPADTLPVPFDTEGAFHRGIDLKASLRSVIRGERKIYVKKESGTPAPFLPDEKNPEPAVFLFDLFPPEKNTHWSLLIAGSGIEDHIVNGKNYEETVRKFGRYFISSISMIHDSDVPGELNPCVNSFSLLEGICLFGNPCINAVQGARWLEETNFRACPALTSTSLKNLLEYYRHWHGTTIDPLDWTTALIRFAIPFAKERAVVIAPDGFRLPEIARREARKRGISLDFLPLGTFSPERITAMRRRMTVTASDADGLSYPPETIACLGEQPDHYFELLPPHQRRQLRSA